MTFAGAMEITRELPLCTDGFHINVARRQGGSDAARDKEAEASSILQSQSRSTPFANCFLGKKPSGEEKRRAPLNDAQDPEAFP